MFIQRFNPNGLIYTTSIPLIFLLYFVFGCSKQEKNNIESFFMYPNPYRTVQNTKAHFKIIFTDNSITENITENEVSCVLTIIDEFGDIIWKITKSIQSHEVNIAWNGQNLSGVLVSPGIYEAKVVISGESPEEKTTKILID